MYYTIISRDEFIKLYRFGSIGISSNYLLDDDENIETKLIELFKILPLEYEESYLILKINDIDNKYYDFEKIQTVYPLNIERIKSVYVLSNEAQHFYKTKVNQKVNFKITSFKTILEQVTKFKEKQDIDEGINILSKQFNFINKEEIKTKLGDNFRDNFLKLERYLSMPFKDFYLDLLSYKRENIFPKNDIGFIYDFVIIAKLQKRENDFIERYPIGDIPIGKFPFYNSLNQNQKEILFENIEFILRTDDEAIKKFINNIDTAHLIVGVIFLKIKYLLKENNKDENTQQEISKIVNSFSTKYKDELSIALYLIGLVYGYKNLYDDYYDFLDLDIFKDSEDTSVKIIEKKEEIDSIDKKLKTLEEENQSLKLELKEMKTKKSKELENKEIIQNDSDIVEAKEEPKEVSSEKNMKVDDTRKEKKETIESHIILKSNLNKNEVVKYTITFLREVAKSKDIIIKDKTKDIYKNSKEDKIRLYNRIFNIEEAEVKENATGLFETSPNV